MNVFREDARQVNSQVRKMYLAATYGDTGLHSSLLYADEFCDTPVLERGVNSFRIKSNKIGNGRLSMLQLRSKVTLFCVVKKI